MTWPDLIALALGLVGYFATASAFGRFLRGLGASYPAPRERRQL